MILAASMSDRQLAISAWTGGTLKVWELASGRQLRLLKGHTDTVHSVAVTPDGRLAEGIAPPDKEQNSYLVS